MAVSNRLRFEVFKRDGHTCQYCGGKPPEVQLTIDHVIPTALGGRDEPQNLTTSCASCNSGKSSTAPDAEQVAAVDARAAQWSDAIRQAAEVRSRAREAEAEYVRCFELAWTRFWWVEEEWANVEGNAPVEARIYADRPMDWRETASRFYCLGLGLSEVYRCAEVALTNQRLPRDRMWRYFCGVCWQEINALQDDAAALLTSGGRV